MPSAVLLSIVAHAALFLLAGMLVVFPVVKKEEKKLVPLNVFREIIILYSIAPTPMVINCVAIPVSAAKPR